MMTNPRQNSTPPANGPAEAIRLIFVAVEQALREGVPLSRTVALFFADRLSLFVDSEVWSGRDDELDADEEYAALDRSHVSVIDQMLGNSVRLSETWLRRIATAFCAAFGLSRHPAEPPLHYPTISGSSAGLRESSVLITRQSRYSAPAEATVSAAENGDPGALLSILVALAESLQRFHPLPCSYVFFLADAFRTLLNNSGAWQAIGQSDASADHRRTFGRAVCRAFHLSKGQATLRKGELPKHDALAPPAVVKLEELLLHGVSRRAATSVILTAYRQPGHRTLEDWLSFMGIPSDQDEPIGGLSLIWNRLEIAKQVRRATTPRRSVDQAYLVVARSLASKLFPDFRSQAKAWAARVLRDSRRRRQAPDRVELAQQIRSAIERELPLPPIREIEQVLRIKAVKGATRLPECCVRKLLPAVREAHKFALSVNAL